MGARIDGKGLGIVPGAENENRTERSFSHLGDFALARFFTGDILLPDSHMACPRSTLGSLFKCHISIEANLNFP